MKEVSLKNMADNGGFRDFQVPRGKLLGDEDAPSRHLWVGNVAMETPEAVVREKFAKFGELESVTVYPQRQYAFVNFQRQEDAERAKEGLVGAQIAGQPLRVEFAKGARPSRHLLVSGIAPSASKEMVEAEFHKHGHVEDFKYMKDKSTAHVDYSRTEDAISAYTSLNGKRFGDEELRIDYRPTVAKRPAPAPSPRIGGKDDPPSEVLWIGFPGNAKFDEETLHSVFRVYGEIVRVKVFASRSYCFVEFRSVRDANSARSALNGKLVHGHRLHIEFSTSEVGPMEDSPPAETSSKKPRVSAEPPPRTRFDGPFSALPQPESNPCWQGLITKGGSVVCEVRGFPAGGRPEIMIPEVVDLVARTELDTLVKHVQAGSEPRVILLTPAKEMDMTPFEELLHHLREKRRGGVATIGDYTRLFLVPPSTFSEQVLKLTRTDCLFGVVVNVPQPLKLPQQQQQQHFQNAQSALQPQQPVSSAQSVGSAAYHLSTPPGWDQPLPGFNPTSNVVAFGEAPQQQQPQASAGVGVPQLSVDQLAQLTQAVRYSQQQKEPSPLGQAQQQQQPPQSQQQNWLLPSQAPASLANCDPDLLQRTVALAELLLKQQQQQQ